MGGMYTVGGTKTYKKGYSGKGGKGNGAGKKKKNSGLTAEQKRRLEEVKTKVNILTIIDKEIRPNLPSGYWSSGMRLLETTHVDLCPLHAEDTGSFRIFPNTNTCDCYAGCGGGDNVWLYREFNNKVLNQHIAFGSAIDYLYETYISGKKVAPVIFSDLMKAVQINTPQEVFSFFFKLSVLEGQLSAKQNGCSLDKLLEYYRSADQLKRLIANNEIKADIAMQELDKIYGGLKATWLKVQ